MRLCDGLLIIFIQYHSGYIYPTTLLIWLSRCGHFADTITTPIYTIKLWCVPPHTCNIMMDTHQHCFMECIHNLTSHSHTYVYYIINNVGHSLQSLCFSSGCTLRLTLLQLCSVHINNAICIYRHTTICILFGSNLCSW